MKKFKKISLKMWQKISLGAALGVAAIGTIVGILISVGTDDGLKTHKSYAEMNTLILDNLDSHLEDSLDNDRDLGKLDGNKFNNSNYQNYVINYMKEHRGTQPHQVVHFGATKFVNELPLYIKPTDFLQYINWFKKTAIWGPEINQIQHITLSVESSGKGEAAVLGGAALNFNLDNRSIKFYMGSQFGEVTFARDALSSFADVLAQKSYSSNVFVRLNSKPLRIDEVNKLIEKVNSRNDATNDPKKKLYLYSVEKNGEDAITKDSTYDVLFSRSPEMTEKLEKNLFWRKSIHSDVHVIKDASGHYSITAGGVPLLYSKERIPSYEFGYGLAGEVRNTYPVAFLENIALHEYGHMMSYNYAYDMSESVLIQGSQGVSGLTNLASSENINAINYYLEARMPNLRAVRVNNLYQKMPDITPNMTKEETISRYDAYQFIGFEIKNTDNNLFEMEDLKSIFGFKDAKLDTQPVLNESDFNKDNNPDSRWQIKTYQELEDWNDKNHHNLTLAEYMFLCNWDVWNATLPMGIRTAPSQSIWFDEVSKTYKEHLLTLDDLKFTSDWAKTMLKTLKDFEGNKIFKLNGTDLVNLKDKTNHDVTFNIKTGKSFNEADITVQAYEVDFDNLHVNGKILSDVFTDKDELKDFVHTILANQYIHSNDDTQWNALGLGDLKIWLNTEIFKTISSQRNFNRDVPMVSDEVSPSSVPVSNTTNSWSNKFNDKQYSTGIGYLFGYDELLARETALVSYTIGEETNNGNNPLYGSSMTNNNFIQNWNQELSGLGMRLSLFDGWIEDIANKLVTDRAQAWVGHPEIKLSGGKPIEDANGIPTGELVWDTTKISTIDLLIEDLKDNDSLVSKLDVLNRQDKFKKPDPTNLKLLFKLNNTLVEGMLGKYEISKGKDKLFANTQDNWLRMYSGQLGTEGDPLSFSFNTTQIAGTSATNQYLTLNHPDSSAGTFSLYQNGNGENMESKVDNGATDYWKYLLHNLGVHNVSDEDRTIAGLGYQKEQDGFTAWGYIKLGDKRDQSDVNDNQSVQSLDGVDRILNAETPPAYITFEKDGVKVFKPLHIGQNNIHYNTVKYNANKNRQIEDEGYTSWSMDYIVCGNYKDADLGAGQWKVYFSDEDKEKYQGTQLTLGSKRYYLSANGKPFSIAPAYFERMEDGTTVLNIQDYL